jgi:hypothetical protein
MIRECTGLPPRRRDCDFLCRQVGLGPVFFALPLKSIGNSKMTGEIVASVMDPLRYRRSIHSTRTSQEMLRL